MRIIILGSIIGLLLGIAVNLYASTKVLLGCFDCYISWGWPMDVFRYGGYFYTEEILWGGVAVNAVFFIAAGILLTAGLSALTRRMFAVRRR